MNDREHFKSKLAKHTNILVHCLNNAPYFGTTVLDTFKRTNYEHYVNWTQEM